jgi:hypothetical protein
VEQQIPRKNTHWSTAVTREIVAAAVERVRTRDRTLGTDAEVVAQWLTSGEGTDAIYQAGVQHFLWWMLPRRFAPNTWRRLVEATAALLDQLGFGQYADIARSQTTCDVLESWAESYEQGQRRFLAANAASGVQPPDTELVRWGSALGIDEATAQEAVERALEAAIVAGDLTPGARGWKQVAQQICDRTLTAPLDDPGGQTLLTRLVTERTEWWIDASRVSAHRRMRDKVSRKLLTPIPPPADIDTVIAPMRWLLECTAAEATLTQSGYLARSLVLEAVERFEWWHWDKPPRSEADVPQIGLLREVAGTLRLTRRRGRRLLITANGARLLADPERLWRALASTLGGTDDFERMIAELAGLRLLERAAIDDELPTTLTPIVVAQGWQTPDGPVAQRDVDWALSRRWWWWRVLGLLDEEHRRWQGDKPVGQNRVALTSAGEATVLAYLRDRAIAPRFDVID